MKRILLVVLIGITLASFSGDKPAYTLFTGNGKSATWTDILKSCESADVICFGEMHNNILGHWLQLQLLKDLNKAYPNKISVGAEMFEADDQIVLTEFAQKKITETHLETEAKLWNNYKTDYKPFFSYAFQNQIPVVATNIPRRYASLISKKGFKNLDSIAPLAKSWIAPLPFELNYDLPSYKEMMAMDMSSHGGPSGTNIVNSQAAKDATMAHFILANWSAGRKFLHLNGAYHSKNHEGIVWYLMQKNPKLKVLTISMTEGGDMSTLPLESKNEADYMLVFPTDAMKSY